METKRNNLVFVTSILMIIGGAISIITAIIAIAGVSMLLALGFPGIYVLALIFALVAGVLELVVGILGCKNAANPAKAQMLFVWGIIIIVLSLLSTIISVAIGGSFNVLSFILSLVLPILFLIGTIQMKKAA